MILFLDTVVRNKNRATFSAMVKFTHTLGAKHITGLPGVLHKENDPANNWEIAVEEATWRLNLCRQHEITYAIEAHVGSILPDPKTTLRFLKDVPNLTLTLDYGHFIYQEMSNEDCHPLLPYASHFHARGGAPGALQSTVPDNTIDFQNIVRHLKNAKYSGYYCLEYVWVDWENCNRTDNISETLRLRDLLTGKS
ncbi:MAG: sugar phosphate isomerase/epimerase family protein [Chthoniobacterales bacterium]